MNIVITGKVKKLTLVGLPLIFLLSYIPFVSAQDGSPTIGEFEAPNTVYANKYFLLNATINDLDGITQFVNATIEISNSVIFEWENATNTFSELSDPYGYATLDTAGSICATINSTAYRLGWRIKLSWSYVEGSVNVVSNNTRVFDSVGASGSGDYAGLFIFEDDLIVSSASVDDGRVNPNQTVTFTGQIFYEGTSIPPGSGSSALLYDGVDDYVDAPVAVTQVNPATLEAWVKPSAVSAGSAIVYNGDSSGNGFGFGLGAETKSYKLTGHFARIDWIHTGVSIDVTGNVWVHIVMVLERYSPLETRVTFYKDGASAWSAIVANPLMPTTRIRIGRDRMHHFSGIIDEVRIYNRALTSTEISEHHQGIYTNNTGLMLYQDFDGDVEDKSGRRNHGTVYGPTWVTGKKVNVGARVEVSGISKKSLSAIEADGTFTFPGFMAESSVAQYVYNVYGVTDQNTVQNQTVNVIVDRIKIASKGATDDRTNIGENVDIYFIPQYEYDNVIIDSGKGTIYINGTAATWDAANKRWKRTVSQPSVGSWMYVVSSVSETYYGLIVVYDAAEAQQVIWDRIEIYYFDLNSSRVNVNDNVEVRVRARLAYDGHALGSGDSILVNGTDLTWDSANGWFKGIFCETSAGQRSFEVSSGNEVDYGITVIHHRVPKPTVVWKPVVAAELVYTLCIISIIGVIFPAVLLRRYWLPRIRSIMFRSKIRRYFGENPGVIFVVGFQALLLAAAGLLVAGNLDWANRVAIWAYYLLVIGVILQLITFVRHRKKSLRE